jgi:hypothetical protein
MPHCVQQLRLGLLSVYIVAYCETRAGFIERTRDGVYVTDGTKASPRTFLVMSLLRHGVVPSVRKRLSFVFIYYCHVQRVIIRYKDTPEVAEVKLNSDKKITLT